jgi:MFS family permease
MIDGLEAAISDGVIDRATAQRLEPYLSRNPMPDMTDPDDEKLRLITGFNDIFVTIGLLMFLGALGYLGSSLGLGSAALAVAAASWGLAEFFTRKRRMALPSIVLLLMFVGAVFLAVLGFMSGGGPVSYSPDDLTPESTLVAASAATLAAFAHWHRFHVPITIAAGVAALAAILLALCNMAAPHLLADHPVPIFLALGLAIFALAMWFDSSDLTRQTRRTDIAFWLHLLAAPIIVHPILLSIAGSNAPLGAAVQVIMVFLCLAVIALVVDRRAILVSSLSYLAYAAGNLITAAGMESSSFAASTLAVGAIVLMLSAAWRPLRRNFMRLLPASMRARLPAVT